MTVQKNIPSIKNAHPRNLTKAIALDLLRKINTSYSLYLYLSIVYHNKEPVRSPDPNAYFTADSYLQDAQAYALVSKNYVLPKQDTKANAVKAFIASEASCRETNIRFASRSFNFFERSVLETARRYCEKILKEPNIEEPDFGPGSTIYLRGKHSNIITKLSELPETTPKCYETVVKSILHYMPHYAISSGMVVRERTSVTLGPSLAKLVESDEFLVVPKNYKTDRGICIGPSGQMLIQKGIAKVIRRRLRNYGYDLDRAPKLHAELARVGSINGLLSTIDLASASDTIAYEFVKFMLPESWFDLLNSVRSSKVLLPASIAGGKYDKFLTYEKFSAMGNGYTFELESLLFLCLLLAVREHLRLEHTQVSVFGDDMICHPEVAYQMVELLPSFGFTVNLEKSFIEGPFRESCGSDFFRGIAVRPVYLRDKRDEQQTVALYYYLNRVREIASTSNFNVGCDKRFFATWQSILRRVPEEFLIFGPSDLGDTVILDHRWKRGRNGRVACIEKKSRTFKKFRNSDHALSCALYGIQVNGVIPRSSKYTIKTKWLPDRPWTQDFLAWI